MSRLLNGIATALCLAGSVAAQADTYAEHPEMLLVVDELVKEDGFDRGEVTTLLSGAERRQPILDAIARPAEKALSWGEYRPRFIEDKRIRQGLEFWKQHEAALARANEAYGVPPEIILAIIGVETRYGRNKGSWKIVDALSTLAFDYPPRSAFFRKELKEFVRLGKSAHLDIANATGSYAGAMGFPQFMPSSYRNFAVDFDNDGVTDLINNPVDAIGSVANYFKAHGWKSGAPVAARALPAGNAGEGWTNQGLDAKGTVSDIEQAGLTVARCIAGDVIPVDYCADPSPREKATAWKLDGERGVEYWIGFNNFYVITRYNRSEKYSLAVLQLSRELRKARQFGEIRTEG